MQEVAKTHGVFELPDANVIELGTECFRCPEALFEPRLMLGLKMDGISDMIVQAISKACSEGGDDNDLQKELYGNIVLSGGSNMFKGISDRLSKDLHTLIRNIDSSSSITVTIVARPERKYSVWIGGSILANLSTFQSMYISREEYDESGASIVHSKCSD